IVGKGGHREIGIAAEDGPLPGAVKQDIVEELNAQVGAVDKNLGRGAGLLNRHAIVGDRVVYHGGNVDQQIQASAGSRLVALNHVVRDNRSRVTGHIDTAAETGSAVIVNTIA